LIVDRQLEVTVREEGHEAFRAPLTQVERLLETNVFEVACWEDGEKTITVAWVQTGRFEDLATEWNWVAYGKVCEVKIPLSKEETVRACRAEGAPLPHCFAEVVEFEEIIAVHRAESFLARGFASALKD
jgi:hypothetical protein